MTSKRFAITSRTHQVPQRGFTLVELGFVLIIITILAGAGFAAFNVYGAAGSSALRAMENLRTSAMNFRNDLGCFPATAKALIDKSSAACTNGTDVSTKWTDPYHNGTPTTTAGALQLNNIENGVTMNYATKTLGTRTALVVRASGLSESTTTKLVDKCNGDSSSQDLGCAATVTSGVGTVDRFVTYL
jgi:prepilin-type N-terminal cleavage/methylation domain-containing protein